MHSLRASPCERSVRRFDPGLKRLLAGILLCIASLLSTHPAPVFASDNYDAAYAQTQQRYPAASTTPREAADVPPAGKVERSAPPDETASQVTAGGVRLFRRTEQCFPTETRNLFSEVDKVASGAEALQPMPYSDGKSVPPDARKAIMGQNTWMLWGEGNEAFWGWVQQHGYGIVDFLVMLDSRNRDHRFVDSGMINQPGMKARPEPAAGLGLFIDQADGEKITMTQPATDIDATTGKLAQRVPIPKDDHHTFKGNEPYTEFFEIGDQDVYKTAIEALPKDGVDPLVYGYPSGVIGLRLWPNPDFFGKSTAAKEARDHWMDKVAKDGGALFYYNPRDLPDNPQDAQRAEAAAALRADPKLIRPFRVSMACAFCHVGPHPLATPADPEHPAWGDLSSMIGDQYWSPPAIFSNTRRTDSFLWQFVASQQPGTIDTSLVATDHINNPNTINAIFEVNARLARAQANPKELQSAENLTLKSVEDEPLDKQQWRHTPRVLLDGADSVGIEGALLRVYLNIGAYSEQWRDVQNTIIGFAPQRPFDLATIRAKSDFWNTTEHFRVGELESFFTYVSKTGATVSQSMKLNATADGRERLAHDNGDIEAGRDVFLRNCAVCHSSKQPENLQLAFSRNWRESWDDGDTKLTLPMDFADWEAFKLSTPYLSYVTRLLDYMKSQPGGAEGFFKDNYLSTDVRVPITLVGTNSQRAVGTNGMRGQVWDNFTSETYKALPAVGMVHFFNPFMAGGGVDEWGNNDTYAPPGGGPGYYRPASLVSLWATAPLLHNNALGIYNRDPHVKTRLIAFDDAMDKLLHKGERAYTLAPLTGGKPRENVYPDDKARAYCRDHPGDPSLDCSELRGDFRKTFEAARIAGKPGFRDVGFIFRTTKDSYLDFEGPFIRPLLAGVIGNTTVSFLSFYVWLILAFISLILVFVGKPRLAGSLLAASAAVLGALLRASGLDTILPWLWTVPVLMVIGAGLFFWFCMARRSARAFFAVAAVAFLALGVGGRMFVEGHLGNLRVGPIPRGTPVNLIMNIDPDAPTLDLLNAAAGLARGLAKMHVDPLNDGTFKALDDFQKEAAPALMKASKCPDFVLDRGHWFGEKLSEENKKQLKAFLETL